jgi:hypothetical protein
MRGRDIPRRPEFTDITSHHCPCTLSPVKVAPESCHDACPAPGWWSSPQLVLATGPPGEDGHSTCVDAEVRKARCDGKHDGHFLGKPSLGSAVNHGCPLVVLACGHRPTLTDPSLLCSGVWSCTEQPHLLTQDSDVHNMKPLPPGPRWHGWTQVDNMSQM